MDLQKGCSNKRKHFEPTKKRMPYCHARGVSDTNMRAMWLLFCGLHREGYGGMICYQLILGKESTEGHDEECEAIH